MNDKKEEIEVTNLDQLRMTQTYSTTILFLASDPCDASRLRIAQELRAIKEKLQLSKRREQFSLVEKMAVRPQDITQAILDTDPQIIHFSGHGTSEGELCFEDANSKVQPVSCDALSSLFELFSEQVNCVILNCCYSEIQAKAIVEHVGYVVGMKKEIGDEAAINFSIGFYRALSAGRSLEDAYNFGILELKLLGIPEDLTPILLQKNIVKHMCVDSYDRTLHKDYAIFTRDQKTILLNPKAYSSIQAILNDLYTHYFSKIYPILSYGQEWILLGHFSFNVIQVLVPFEWVNNIGHPLDLLDYKWAVSNVPSQQNIIPGTKWKVIDRKTILDLKDNLIILASNHSKIIIKRAMSSSKSLYMYTGYCSKSCTFQAFKSQNYKYVFVFLNTSDRLITEQEFIFVDDLDDPEKSQHLRRL